MSATFGASSGEEFLVLLPGARTADAWSLAEAIRSAIEDETIEGVGVTLSCGVDSSDAGGPFDYERVFAACDAALYRAKRDGRNRVCVTEPALAPDVI